MGLHLYACSPEAHTQATRVLEAAGISVRNLTSLELAALTDEQRAAWWRIYDRTGRWPDGNVKELLCTRGDVSIRVRFSKDSEGYSIWLDTEPIGKGRNLGKQQQELLRAVLEELGPYIGGKAKAGTASESR